MILEHKWLSGPKSFWKVRALLAVSGCGELVCETGETHTSAMLCQRPFPHPSTRPASNAKDLGGERTSWLN